MKNNVVHGDYISMMVQETFEGVSTGNNGIFNLDDSNILSFPQNEQLSFDFDSISGTYDLERKCYIFTIAGLEIEFPVNWKIFRKSPQQVREGHTLFAFTENDDPYKLLFVFQSVLGFNLSLVEFKWLKSRPSIVLTPANEQLRAA